MIKNCKICNTTVSANTTGFYCGDSIKILESMIQYLKKHNEEL